LFLYTPFHHPTLTGTAERSSCAHIYIDPGSSKIFVRAERQDVVVNGSRLIHHNEHMELRHGAVVAVSMARVFYLYSDPTQPYQLPSLADARVAYLEVLLLE